MQQRRARAVVPDAEAPHALDQRAEEVVGLTGLINHHAEGCAIRPEAARARAASQSSAA